MHMARLYDPSLMPGMYSLEAQSEHLEKEINETKLKMIEYLRETRKGDDTA